MQNRLPREHNKPNQTSSTSSLFTYFNDGVGVNLGRFGKWSLRASNFSKKINFSYSTMLTMFSITTGALAKFAEASSDKLSEQIQFKYGEADYQIKTIPFYKLMVDGIQEAINVGMLDNTTISALTNSTDYLNEVFKIQYTFKPNSYYIEAILNRGLGPLQQSLEDYLINFMKQNAKYANDEADAKSLYFLSIALPSLAVCWMLYLGVVCGIGYKCMKQDDNKLNNHQSINTDTLTLNDNKNLLDPKEIDGFEELTIEAPKNWTCFNIFNNLKNSCLNIIFKNAKSDNNDNRNYNRLN